MLPFRDIVCHARLLLHRDQTRENKEISNSFLMVLLTTQILLNRRIIPNVLEGDIENG